jgi:putative membrane protein
MKVTATVATLFVAAAHLGFLVLEMFFWDHPFGRALFSMTAEQSATTAVLAANQGLYNGLLAAGLIWGISTRNRKITTFLLICIVIAGVYGGLSASPFIFLVQAAPAMIALIITKLSQSRSDLR